MLSRGLASVDDLSHYRGGGGQWSFILHRLTGLGVLLFLMLHILDTSSVYFTPRWYNIFVEFYKRPSVGLAEVALAAALVFHALNGVRVAVLDFWPNLWRYDRAARWLTWAGFAVIYLPMAAVMLTRIWRYLLSGG
jgi:succinate dehydrogenase / fumarate reductase, cytochrome b subunit